MKIENLPLGENLEQVKCHQHKYVTAGNPVYM
jgi:hypothetical protein